jgi:hypothetical protein
VVLNVGLAACEQFYIVQWRVLPRRAVFHLMQVLSQWVALPGLPTLCAYSVRLGTRDDLVTVSRHLDTVLVLRGRVHHIETEGVTHRTTFRVNSLVSTLQNG